VAYAEATINNGRPRTTGLDLSGLLYGMSGPRRGVG